MQQNKKISEFFQKKGWNIFKYQQDSWLAYLNGDSGLINAPTGAGKTYAAFMGALIKEMEAKPEKNSNKLSNLKIIWITPLKALSNDLVKMLQNTCNELGVNWRVETRTGDSSTKVKNRQKIKMPDVLVTTPESLHIILSSPNYQFFFNNLKLFVVDEWHELIESKRGVLVELALSRIKSFNKDLPIWGISATINNLEDAAKQLVGSDRKFKIIKADIEKEIDMITVYPKVIEKFSWSGHIGLTQIKQVLDIIDNYKTTLIFTNTRSFNEIWYQKIIEERSDLANKIAIHNGSINKLARLEVENNINNGRYKAILCTSSLDLGVDFKSVDCIIQIGSPHGASRFLQRAGRSNHQPDKKSKIYFVPTFSLELIEAAALRDCISKKKVEDKLPLIKPFDVLIQYLYTLASSDGFEADSIFKEIKSSMAYADLDLNEWEWILNFICNGGSLKNYDEYSKVKKINGIYVIENMKLVRRHKLSIGTISEDATLRVRMLNGRELGTIEESFISTLKEDQSFWFSGRKLEVINIRNMVALVKNSTSKDTIFPRWEGGRMELSIKFSETIRQLLNDYDPLAINYEEFNKLAGLLKLQNDLSAIPKYNHLLIETLNSREGFHIYFYFFKGRNIHEGLASLLAYRIGKMQSITFSIAMNDYGFELLTSQSINIVDIINKELFSSYNLRIDIEKSVNTAEMARRRFRNIAKISGLVFKGFPGEKSAGKNLQLSSNLLFDVFKEYENDNLLLKQAFDEVLQFQLKETEIFNILEELKTKELVIKQIKRPTPFSFPIMVDRLRSSLSSEKLEDRLNKMKLIYAA